MSLKVVEGQIEFWRMSSALSSSSNSLASQSYREFVSNVANQQSIAPDVLPAQVNVNPMLDETGRLVSYKA